MHTPLQDPAWRKTNSIGVLWVVLGFGMTTCVPFFFRGLRQRNWNWVGLGVLSLLLTIAMFLVVDSTSEGNEPWNQADTFFSALLAVNWAGGMIAIFALNPAWLRFRAGEEAAAFQQPYAQAPYAPAPYSPAPYAPAAGSYPPPAPPVPPVPPVLNINTASAAQLRSLGLPYDVVEALLTSRQLVGNFMSFDHLVASGGVPAQYLVPLRGRLIFSAVIDSRQDNQPPRRSA